jgi:manganese/zinc/iron transport system substrate-binding protein
MAVATTGMVADLVRHVGGDRVEVEALIAPGIDPHLHKPTRSDLARILEADLVFANGVLLEGRMIDSLERASDSGRRVHLVAEEILERRSVPSDDPLAADPHLWMDPAVWATGIDVVRDALSAADPDGAAIYRENADRHRAEILALDAYAASVLASVPAERRVLVTAHDAFGWFGRRYGYEVLAIQGLSTESEAGVRDIERLVTVLVDRGVPAVFVESTVAPRHIEALLAGAAARGHEVVIGAELFSDAMGADGTYEGTYLGMIDHNATSIARALGGGAPSRGRLGSLRE